MTLSTAGLDMIDWGYRKLTYCFRCLKRSLFQWTQKWMLHPGRSSLRQYFGRDIVTRGLDPNIYYFFIREQFEIQGCRFSTQKLYKSPFRYGLSGLPRPSHNSKGIDRFWNIASSLPMRGDCRWGRLEMVLYPKPPILQSVEKRFFCRICHCHQSIRMVRVKQTSHWHWR